MTKIKFLVVTMLIAVVLLAVEIVIVRSVSRYEPEIDVVYAKVKIPENTVIQPDMLQVRKVGIGVAHRQSMRDMGEVSGRIAKADIEEGEMILASRLDEENRMKEIRVKDMNNRLFTVEFKGDQANGWWLAADQYVDIIFVPGERVRSSGGGDSAAIQRLRNIRIAALIDERGRLVKGNEKSVVPKYVSFEVTDSQDEFLAYAKGSGRLEISVIPCKIQ